MGIGVGVFLFKTYEVNEAPVRDTELLGVCFISAYIVCHSFTSNYQSRVFKQYSVGSITMMVYTNLFSTAFHHQDVRPAGLRNHPDGGPALWRVKEAAGRRLMPWRLVLRCASCSPSSTPLSSSATRSRRRSCCSASAS